MAQIVKQALIALILPAVLLLLALSDLASLRSRSAELSLDSYTQIAPFDEAPDLAKKMVFVDIDEKSIAALGQWPWPRHFMAVLMQSIGVAGPAVIGVDILFSESDRFNPSAIENLGDMEAGSLSGILPDGDGNLGLMLEATPSVIAMSLYDGPNVNDAFVPGSVSVLGTAELPVLETTGLLAPIAPLQTAPGAGFVSLSLTRDSIVRFAPMIARHNDRLLPSLSLDMLRVYQGARGHVLKQALDTGSIVNQIRTGAVVLSLDEFGRMPLYHGYSNRFTTLSAIDVIQAQHDDVLADAVVIIGSSASGLKDIHSTNLEAAIAGPLIHLSAVHQLLAGVQLGKSNLTELMEMLAAFLAAFILSLAALRLPILIGFMLISVSSAIAFYLSFTVFIQADILTNGLASTSLIGLSGSLLLIWRGFSEEARRRQLRGAFSAYLAPTMVKEIEKSGQQPELGGLTTDITVMFMDVRGFTTLSERLRDRPQDLTEAINLILDEASQIILAQGGTLDKYIGDAVMAFWNAPVAQRDHARRAVQAAINLQEAMPSINEKLIAQMGSRWPLTDEDGPLSIGIGLATGPAVVGNFGSQTRLSYSALGDTVNLAARLEPYGKQTSLPIAMDARTAKEADLPDIHFIHDVQVRGKTLKTGVYSYLTLNSDIASLQAELAEASIANDTLAFEKVLSSVADLSIAGDYPKGLLDFYQKKADDF